MRQGEQGPVSGPKGDLGPKMGQKDAGPFGPQGGASGDSPATGGEWKGDTRAGLLKPF